ncbi:MAG: OmpA family protein [candidate division WOR-3 bacterium]|nr:MAG: OmpA family protein [candidate division WOR-3 bacterium]
MEILASIIFLFMISEQPDAETVLGRLYFDRTGFMLTIESENMLRRIANKMRAEPNIMIDVNAYTDDTGTPSVNVLLSERMAERVRAYLAGLVDESGGRIRTTGYGPKNPIASNTTPEGRAKNRRVEIVIRKPDAILTTFTNNVQVQPPALRPNWLNPVGDYYLYRGYKVTTGKRSTARIVYPNRGVLRMGEEAMVIIHSLSTPRKEKTQVKDIRLQDGSLAAILKDVPGQVDSSTIVTAIQTRSEQIDDTLVTEKLQDLVVVYQSNAEVDEIGEREVERGEDLLIDRELSFEERHLPHAPRLISPRMHEARYSTDEIAFVWKPSAVVSHLQVAEDSLFQQIAFDAYAASDSVITSLAENIYYWRVSGINEDSLEGEYSDYWTLAVQIDTVPPYLNITLSRGKRENEFILAGHADSDAQLYVDDTRVEMNDDGSFSYVVRQDYRSAFVVARAIDRAGNVTERSCRIPQRPMSAMGITAGICAVDNDRGDKAERGFWYGVQFSRILLPGVSFFLSATVARSVGEMGDALNATDMMPVEIGLRKSFYMGRVSPFLYVRSGFIWSQINPVPNALPGDINYRRVTIDPVAGFGAGLWLSIGYKWHLNLHADYTYIFGESSGSAHANALTRIGLGIQDRIR